MVALDSSAADSKKKTMPNNASSSCASPAIISVAASSPSTATRSMADVSVNVVPTYTFSGVCAPIGSEATKTNAVARKRRILDIAPYAH